MEPVTFRVDRIQVPNAQAAQRVTVGLIAKCIRNAQSYLPIRNLAASIASRAAPKDYYGQVKAIYEDFLNRWRYVKDPVGVETLVASPKAVFHLILAADGRGVGGGKGAGDCDDAACAIGSELSAIGMPVRIVTSRNPGSTRGLFSHIFVQAMIPGHGWVSVDPVGHPLHGFAWTPPHSAIATWDLHGKQLAGDRLFGAGQEENEMETYHGFGLAGSSEDYQWEEHDEYFPRTLREPLPWDVYGLSGFGCYADTMGLCDDGRGYMIEVDEDDMLGNTGLVRTPMLELAPGPFALVNRFGIVLDGTLGLGDDGQVYEYDGMGGFWKKLFKPGKKLIKRVARPILGAVEKLVSRTKVGRKVVKLKNNIAGVALKILKPLLPKVGRWGPLLAPIAAIIPGVGPIISSYMISAGAVARAADKHGVEWIEFVKTDKKTGKKVKSIKLSGKPSDIVKYRKTLKKAGKKYKGLSKKALVRGVKKIKAWPGPQLPRQDLTKKKLLKKGTPEWKSAMKSIGMRAGAFRPGAGKMAIMPRTKKKRTFKQRLSTAQIRRIAKKKALTARRRAKPQTRKQALQQARKAARKKYRREHPTRKQAVRRAERVAKKEFKREKRQRRKLEDEARKAARKAYRQAVRAQRRAA